MVSDGEYCIISVGWGEFSDKVHCDGLERQGATGGDGEEWGPNWVSVDFVHLTRGTAFDVVCDKVFHVGPPVILLYKCDCFRNTRVSSGFEGVKMVKHTPPKIVVFHNNECMFLPKVVIVIKTKSMGFLPAD